MANYHMITSMGKETSYSVPTASTSDAHVFSPVHVQAHTGWCR